MASWSWLCDCIWMKPPHQCSIRPPRCLFPPVCTAWPRPSQKPTFYMLQSSWARKRVSWGCSVHQRVLKRGMEVKTQLGEMCQPKNEVNELLEVIIDADWATLDGSAAIKCHRTGITYHNIDDMGMEFTSRHHLESIRGTLSLDVWFAQFRLCVTTEISWSCERMRIWAQSACLAFGPGVSLVTLLEVHANQDITPVSERWFRYTEENNIWLSLGLWTMNNIGVLTNECSVPIFGLYGWRD